MVRGFSFPFVCVIASSTITTTFLPFDWAPNSRENDWRSSLSLFIFFSFSFFDGPAVLSPHVLLSVPLPMRLKNFV